MHMTVAVFTNTNQESELEDLLVPMLEGNEDCFAFVPCNWPVCDEDIRDFGLVKENGRWGHMENPNAHFDYYNVEKKPVSCAEFKEEEVPYAFVTLDGVWEECEDYSSLEDWAKYWQKMLDRNPKAYVTLVDCHV